MHLRERKSQQRQTNPLILGITQYFQHDASDSVRRRFWSLTADDNDETTTLHPQDIPKRFTVYRPMMLLGPNFATYSPRWGTFWLELHRQSKDERDAFWQRVLESVNRMGGRSGSKEATVVAMNAPIHPTLENGDDVLVAESIDNVMRSPVGLVPLHGDFGPDSLLRCRLSTTNSHVIDDGQPTQADLDSALWVETAQIAGVMQVWAPRWTMFSRGNIREKERIVGGCQPMTSNGGFQDMKRVTFPGLSEDELGESLRKVDVVDFYIGIGYFAFCYLKRGVKRVWGWDLNGWSVEGLKRGCERNGWPCLVIKLDNSTDNHEKEAKQVMEGLKQQDLKCIVFQGDNRHAARTMEQVQSLLQDFGDELNIRHCNLGLLPTSQGSWHDATKVLNLDKGGWLHVHENTEIKHVESKKVSILEDLQQTVQSQKDEPFQFSCEHVEMVKTYAPGVGHFVFDIKLWPAR